MSSRRSRPPGPLSAWSNHSVSLRTATLIWCIIGCASYASAQSTGERRFTLSANLGVQARSVSRTDVGNFDLNREVGVVRTSQSLGPYLVFDAGGSMRVWKWLGFGVAVSHAQGRATATIEAEVPHPFFFDFDRTATASRQGLRHREDGYHLYGHFGVPLSTTTLLTLSGGPSYFDASQELIAEIGTSERGFPFDEVDIASTNVDRVAAGALGFNVGLDLAYWGPRLNPFQLLGLSDRVGIGVGVRYSWAKPQLELLGRPPRSLQVGLVHAVGGVRVAF
jgi:hypothetical protein